MKLIFRKKMEILKIFVVISRRFQLPPVSRSLIHSDT